MPKLHDSWGGYTQIRDKETNKITHAQCNECKKILVKRDAATLNSHKRVCKTRKDMQRERSPIVSNADQINTNSTEKENQSLVGNTLEKTTSMSTPASAIKCTPSTSNINSTCLENQNFDSEKVNLLLLNFILITGAKFEVVESIYFKELMELFNPSYKIPSAADLRVKIVDAAYKKLLIKTETDFLNVLGVSIHETEDTTYVLSFCFDKHMKYKYVTHIVISEVQNDENDRMALLNNFFKDSIATAKCLYGIRVEFLIVEGSNDIELTSVINTDEGKHYVIVSYNTLINKLNHKSFTIHNYNEIQQFLKYKDALDEFEKQLSEIHYSLAFATEKLFELLNNQILSINSSAMEDIMKFISPVSLVSNYLVHTLKGHYIMKFPHLSKVMFEFILQRKEIVEGFQKYHTETDIFKVMLSNKTNYDQNEFWISAKTEENTLANFAITLLSLPATLRRIKFSKLEKILLDYNSRKIEPLTIVLISLFLNE